MVRNRKKQSAAPRASSPGENMKSTAHMSPILSIVGLLVVGGISVHLFRSGSSRPSQSTSYHVRFLKNGNPDFNPGEIKRVSKKTDLDKLGSRLFDENGKRVKELRHVKNGSTIFDVVNKPGFHFHWPLQAIGQKTPVDGLDRKNVTIEMLNHSPKVFYVHNFMSDEEADLLIKYAQDERNPYRIKRSTTGHKSWSEGGEESFASTRTSMNGFDIASPTALRIKKRGFDLLRIEKYDEAMADGIQILRYQQKQAYIPHQDWFPIGQSTDHNWDPQNGGSNRMATLFLYLSDVEEGGQTVFPLQEKRDSGATGEVPAEAKSLFQNGSWEEEMVEKCYQKFSIYPKKGNAILFYSQHPDGALDNRALHGGCPVINGTKWAANMWVWNACRYGQCGLK